MTILQTRCHAACMMDTGNEKTYSIASSECVSHLRVVEWASVGSE